MRRDEDKKSTKERRVERERVLRRESIIKVAEQFFIAHGYDQTMIEQVAEEAGYTKVA
ncbi:MAG: TetR family transcriptional regulator [Candidatus Thorarchaeota archaeon]|jgi:AcrR family transcriptional regulator